MRHEPNTRGNCAACGQLWYGNGRRVVEPYPCAVVLLARERAANAFLREQVAALRQADALRVDEVRDEIDSLREQLIFARRRMVRPNPTLGDMLAVAAHRCVDLMQDQRARAG